MKHKLESRLLKETSNNLRYADDTNLMAEIEEELKRLLMKVKEESGKAGLSARFGSTYTKNWNDTEISMAPAQGWHANLWSILYF